MLSLIDDKGPQTEGIFWIPGDIASYVTLKNKISSGDTVDWEHESTLVAAMALQVRGIIRAQHGNMWMVLLSWLLWGLIHLTAETSEKQEKPEL